jgi:hypothetical protein
VKIMLIMALGVLGACSQKTAADRCVDAQMKVWDEAQNDPENVAFNQNRTDKQKQNDRDQARATAYLFCRQSNGG